MVASVPWWGLMRERKRLRQTCTANFFLSGGLSPYQSGLNRSSCIARNFYISGGRVGSWCNVGGRVWATPPFLSNQPIPY